MKERKKKEYERESKRERKQERHKEGKHKQEKGMCPSVRPSVPCYFQTTKIAVFEVRKEF